MEEKTSDIRFTLEINVNQASAIVDALELYVRLGLGQVEYLAELARFHQFLPAFSYDENGANHKKIVPTDEQLQQVESLCTSLRQVLGYPRGASHGIGSRAVSLSVHRCYEAERVLRKALAEVRQIDPVFVDHDGLIVRYTEDPAPICTLVE